MSNSNYRILKSKVNPESQKVTDITLNEDVDYDNLTVNGIKIVNGKDGVDLSETPYIWMDSGGKACFLADSDNAFNVTKLVLQDATFTHVFEVYPPSEENRIFIAAKQWDEKAHEWDHRESMLEATDLYITPQQSQESPDYFYVDDNPFPYSGVGEP